MDKALKLRGTERNAVTRAITSLKTLLIDDPTDKLQIRISLEILEKHVKKLNELDEQVKEFILDDPTTTDDSLQEECDDIAHYMEQAVAVRVKAETAIYQPSSSFPVQVVSEHGTPSHKRNFKLPKIDLLKFTGALTEWLGWWAQFRKIHEDEELHTSDKFTYLVQSMKHGTRAYDVVKRFPQSVENYPKAVEALRERFGKKKMLQQVYVRDLIGLMLDNRSKENISLSTLYDRLISSLQSLDSLEVSTDQMAGLLFPMVESSIPDETLQAWQRSPNYGRDGSAENPPKTEMDYLMEFLKTEIENEDQRKLAQEGFGISAGLAKRNLRRESSGGLPTAAGLFFGNGDQFKLKSCIFCDKQHESRDCLVAQGLTYEDRKNRVAKKGACFICLRAGHTMRKCRANVVCVICSRRHQSILCEKLLQQSSRKISDDHKVQSNLNITSEVLLRTLMVELENPDLHCKKAVRILLDCGSQRSYVLEHTAKELRMKPVERFKITHQLFGGTEIPDQPHNVYQVKLNSYFRNFSSVVRLMDHPRICGTLPRINNGPWVRELTEKGIFVSDVGSDRYRSPEVELLIGADYLGNYLTGKLIKLSNGLTATETEFGWALMGRTNLSTGVATEVLSSILASNSVCKLWDLENIGIGDPVETETKEQREQATYNFFLHTVSRSKGRYSVRLPWTNTPHNLPNNRSVAEKRLVSTSRRLKSLNKWSHYNNIVIDWENSGIVTRIKDSYIVGETGVHYLPHRGVFKDSRTTPVRPVFDASCKANRHPSLNDCLEKGPNLLELIPSILLRFRMGNIGVIADIRKAFLMIEVNEEDRDYLRFLWWEDETETTVTVFRHNRVVFGMNCSPFLLNAVVTHHLSQYRDSHPVTVRAMEKSMYVDNLVFAVQDVKEFLEFKAAAVEIMAQAKMDLRQWERSGARDEYETTNVLGMKWDKIRDELFCEPISCDISNKVTKRIILSQIQRVFDPLGFLSPMMIVPKILLQRAWLEDRHWDAEVSSEIKNEFETWWMELGAVIDKIRLPRNCTGGRKTTDHQFQLHVFGDASKQAYAAVIFLRVETDRGVRVQLLQSKTRVAPLKPVTIPRLELLSCTIGSRLAAAVRKALAMEEVPTYYWSDSTTAISWIARNNTWGTFVGNRVNEICKLSKNAAWEHIPGNYNPADLPSRGVSPLKFFKSRWWEGPDWLKKRREEWPRTEEAVNEEEVNQEKRKISTLIVTDDTSHWYLRTNSYISNLRTMAYVLRFVNRLRKRKVEDSTLLTSDELKEAEITLFRIVQSECFEKDMKLISGLKIEKDKEGILRVRTKVSNRRDDLGFKRPILLPKSHPLVKQLIREEHIFNSHGGAQLIMSKIRERAWVIQGRRTIKSILRNCVTCRRFDSRKASVPTCALPEDRVKDASAFQITGIDLAGPLTLKNSNKIYIVLFTCAVYRCVHLELVESLSTEDFLLSFVRFCKRMRRPEVIYSDNGTNFKGAVNLMEKIDWTIVEKKTRQMKITWRFNPPSAPWWGGWWERLVRSVKDLLRRNLGFRKLNQPQLETCLCEVESAINHRPLTCVTEDGEDLIPLTPSMFMYDLPFDETVSESKLLKVTDLQKKKKSLDKLLEELRRRFRTEYLGQLIQRGKEQGSREFKVGEIVLVEQDNLKRIFWPMARILELVPGKDGVIRVAKLKMKTGTLVRPLQRLFPLEVQAEDADQLQHTRAPTEQQENLEPEGRGPGLDDGPKLTKSGRVSRKPVRYLD